jgi:putative ABC transport system substrate-binding protein
MKRRAFVRGLSTLTTSLAGLALLNGCSRPFWDRRASLARIGVLSLYQQGAVLGSQYLQAFMTGMRELGWVQDQNAVFHVRYADDGPLRDLAAELARLPVDVILTIGSSEVLLAARAATSTVPIVVAGVADPVATGLAASLAHPGGNVTGAMLSTGQDPKNVELLKDCVPGLARLAILFNPAAAAASPQIVPTLEQSAETVGIQTLRTEAPSADDFESAFARARAWSAQALFVLSDSTVVNPHYGLVADLALRSRLPSMTVLRPYAEAGGLMTYGPNAAANYVRAASYVDRILRGAQPGDLPIERPAVYELVVNLKTAQALGISFPPDVARQVTDWIE